MKIFITGSAGFIGYHLHKSLLEQGHQVIGIDNFSHPSKAPHKAIYGDVRYYNDIEPHVKWADVVYHLAAQIHVDKSITNSQETIDVNVIGTLNVLEACRKYKKKLVFASSSEVYGTAQYPYIHEDHPLDAQSPYAASKVAGDRLCKSYIDTYGMDISILRNFNTFGPWQNDGSYGGVIAIFTRKALNGEDLLIYGDGTQERDYMDINDAIQAYRIASTMTGVMNAGTGKTITINDIAKLVKRITGSKSKIVHGKPRAGEVQRLCARIEIADTYGFKPSTDFEGNLTKYIDWYRANIVYLK